MIKNRLGIGRWGEDFACKCLIGRGYKILARNYRKKFGEIDVIARSSDKTLVFCEVKTIVEKPGFPVQLSPEDNLTFEKIQKMRRIANFFAAQNPYLINEDRGWRIDLIAIVLQPDEAIKRIQHYENI